MSFLEYLLVLTGVICCTAVPVSDPNAPQGSCGVPPRFPDKELQGIWNEKFYEPGKRAQYSCRPGFSRLGSIQYLCSEREWVPLGTLGQCKKKSCGHPGDIEFGTFELKKEEEFVFGAVVEYACNDGYQMISRHKTRECTATGWTNYRPECEVKFCPPVQVDSNVNLLTTSYDEEYSVGQVIRFECKNANQKLNGASEIFCTSKGEWNAEPPICKEISCGKPKIDHGSVTGPNLYKDRETTEYSCDPGYKPATPTGLTCTRNDWSPMPLCEEIVCYQESVKYGNVKYTKENYRDGETVELACIEGYQIEHNPEELRKCTSRGWSPPLKCISKKCDKPTVLNGNINSWYSFPLSAGRSVYFACNSGFSTSIKESYELITCTKNGWDHEPKCFKKCNSPSESSMNAYITHTTSPYIEGEKLRFQCYRDYATLDRQQTGEITCLPDGKFSAEKCHKTCQTPKLPHGEYKTRESTFEVGGYVLYECNEGYFSSNKAYEGRSQCGSDGWYPKPECKEIRCPLRLTRGDASFKFGKVIYYQCSGNSTLEGASSSQCFYYGWGPTFPICKDPEGREFPLLVDIKTEPKESNCPTASAPPNARIRNKKEDEYFSEDVMEIECNPGYLLYGSERVLCKDGKWQSPPLCNEKIPCSIGPPPIINGEIKKETLADRYYTGSTVKYTCADGYHIIGSDENKCIDGKWLLPPTCVENSCGNPEETENGKPRDDRKDYKHAESAAYECFRGYKLSESEAAVCLYGKWDRIPKCIYSSCGPPRKISNGEIRGQEKNTYLTGEKVFYDCVRGFTVGNNENFITCENAAWTEPPECRRIGQSCGAPPVVQNGDVTDLKRLSYLSGSIVKYKCANFYKLEGKETITCTDGEWEKEPICRVPCTIREIDMQENNIRFKHRDDKKLYSEHSDSMSFVCISGYTISDEKRLRIQCLDGVLKFPKCLKEGFCVLQQTEMSRNNIRYNKSNEIENGQTIEFECVEGLVPEKGLKQTCMNKRITYPKCSAGRLCLPPKISNALISPKKEDGYESGSSIDIKCEDTHVLNGQISVKCDNGKWDELPQCFKPCTISTRDLDKNHIEMKPSENPPEIPEHGTEVNVKCKANFKRPGSLTALCYDGIMKYPKCFSGDFCRINQQSLDDNFLDLDEKHDNEVFYEAGETVSFKCKAGYRNRTGLTGTCTKPDKEANYGLTYPVCT